MYDLTLIMLVETRDGREHWLPVSLAVPEIVSSRFDNIMVVDKMNDLVTLDTINADIFPWAEVGFEEKKQQRVFSMEQIIRAFLGPLAENSRITIRHALRRVADDLGYSDHIHEVPWHMVDASVLRELVRRWHDGDMSNATIRIYVYAVRGLVQQCYTHGKVPLEQYALLKEVKCPRGRNRVGRGQYVQEKDRRALIRSCQEDERAVIGLRDLAMIALLFGAGLRRAEAASLQIEKLNLEEGTFRLVVKGGDYVEKYLAGWTIYHLRNWISKLNSQGQTSGPVLRKISKSGKALRNMTADGVYQALGARSERAGVKMVRPHDCRRSLATDLIRSHGLNVAKIALGHASITTTAIYDMTDKDAMRGIFSEKSI
jgi:site-specific recombinase XerC